MAKPDAATADPLTELNDTLRDGRKRPLNFALLKAKEGVVLKCHPIKSADVMFREAKGAGGMPAFSCMGVLTVQGKVMQFAALSDEVPRNLPKLAKKHFANLGLQVKVLIVLPSGTSLDDEDPDPAEAAEGATPAGAGFATAAAEEVDPAQAAALEKVILDTLARIDAQAGAPVDLLDDLRMRTEAARQQLQSGNLDQVQPLLDAVNADIDGIEAQGLAQRGRMQAEFDRLAPDLATLRGRAVPPVARKADALAAAFAAEIGRDLKKAGAALTLLTGFLRTELARLPPAPAAGAAKETPPGTPAPDASRPPPDSAEACFADMTTQFGSFWDQVCLAPPPDDAARMAEHSTIQAQQDRIRAFFAAGAPTPERLPALMAELGKLSNLVETARQIAQIEATQPETAMKMRQAMTGFDAELGAGTAVTPELVKQLRTDQTAAAARRTAAQQALAAAQAQPPGRARDAALAAAQAEMTAADQAGAAADRKLQAAEGKQGLSTAMTSGPLAPDAARPLADADAARFVDAFPRDPALATFGLEEASTSQNPGAIAAGMGMLCDRMDQGFAAADGRTPPAGFDGRAYAQNLIRGAGAEGGDFMAGAADYIGRGDHLAPNPMPSPPNANAARLERDRSNHLSRAMLGPDGKIDPAGPAAQTAMGHLRFNPEVVATPTPALNVHAGRMMGTLSDPANLARAQTTLDGVGTPAGGAQNLLGRALGKPAGSVTQDDARQQVMGALMTPVHQGDVGSCFATAGVRRMSTSDPLEAMGRYAEIASTGIFRPRNGQDPIPAVQSFNPDENPLIRSLEYSAATVTAGMESNFRNQMMQRALTNSVAGLMDPVGDGPGFWSQAGFDNWEADEPLIRQTLVDSFAVEYDATRATPVSPDGSSSKGIYVLVQLRPSRSIIDTEPLFVAALTERVLTAIGEPADSDKAKKIAAVINSRSYLDTLMQNGEAPWKMAGGGFGVEADNVLFGGTHATPEVTDARSGWDDLLGQTTTERSAEVLADILRNTQGNAAQMVPLETVGIHVFNALPNHPSMQALREGGDIEGNIQRTLVEPGRRVASTPLTDVRAGEITREVLLALKRWDGNRTRHALMDTALGGGPGASGLTPKALSARLMTALSAYLDRLALDLADGWRARELNAGTPHTDAERDAKRDENRVSFGKTAESMILSATMKEVRIPSVTIADSNWGDGTRDVMMVMAPHPHTGELVMWEQSLPGGSMSLMGEEWTDTTWLRVTGPGSS